MDKKEHFMRELNWRTNLWERKRDSAKRRIELDNNESKLAVIDLAVAEDALERIEKKKKEIWDTDKGVLGDVSYPEPEITEGAHMHTLLPPIEEEEPQYAKVTKTTTVKKERAKKKRVPALAPEDTEVDNDVMGVLNPLYD